VLCLTTICSFLRGLSPLLCLDSCALVLITRLSECGHASRRRRFSSIAPGHSMVDGRLMVRRIGLTLGSSQSPDRSQFESILSRSHCGQLILRFVSQPLATCRQSDRLQVLGNMLLGARVHLVRRLIPACRMRQRAIAALYVVAIAQCCVPEHSTVFCADDHQVRATTANEFPGSLFPFCAVCR
jgi:hypothetical protein